MVGLALSNKRNVLQAAPLNVMTFYQLLLINIDSDKNKFCYNTNIYLNINNISIYLKKNILFKNKRN